MDEASNLFPDTLITKTAMRSRKFQFQEDPERPQHLLHTRENFEIDAWVSRRERDCWLRLIAFQLIFGSLVWSILFT